MANENVYIGEELKFLVTMTADGFNMEDDDYEIVISCGNKKKTLYKSDVLVDGDGNHYITINTAEFKKGDLMATVYAYVPDPDFPDGFRTEVDRSRLATILNVK